ncbi:MAG: glycosyltransferase [Myxococcota bacterium]
MRLGVITSSWPSRVRPWAGHFVADLCEGLASRGWEVEAVAPSWVDDGAPGTRSGVRLVPAEVGGVARSPGRHGRTGVRVLGALRREARRREADVWLCHWWPTALAVPRTVPRLVVLHGSDVDLMERLPARVSRAATSGARVVAVADGLARRAAARTGRVRPAVCRLGARVAEGPQGGAGFPAWWLDAPGPRVLTVGREAPGKGLDVAREAARRLTLPWLVVTPALGLGPAGVRGLVAAADLVVVPILDGPGLPREGHPHVITQALAAGVPVVGGPNAAVREALRDSGQVEVASAGPAALARAVRRALEPVRHASLRAAAREAGAGLRWDAVLPEWEAHLIGAVGL